jgi:hypothetical protein
MTDVCADTNVNVNDFKGSIRQRKRFIKPQITRIGASPRERTRDVSIFKMMDVSRPKSVGTLRGYLRFVEP